MPKDGAATRRRLLDAATAEFSRYGIAGARVDRIAEAAGANKAQIYAWFSSKDGLFDAVFAEHLTLIVDVVPFDATDLAGYAVRLYVAYSDHLPRAMFRFSIVYLAALFSALLLDHFLQRAF